jgi:hypothetical protein
MWSELAFPYEVIRVSITKYNEPDITGTAPDGYSSRTNVGVKPAINKFSIKHNSGIRGGIVIIFVCLPF